MLGARPVHAVEQADILRVLAPIWTDKPETARRARQRIRAALGSGMAGLVLPDAPGALILAPDYDGPGHETAGKLGLRAELLGWRVSLLPPPEGCSDWNDRAMGRAFA